MKTILFALLSLSMFAGAAKTQTLAIDSIAVSPKGIILMLYGDFGSTVGSVTLNGNVLAVHKWTSDSIECFLQPPSAGVLQVSVNADTGADRILEEMSIVFQRAWGAGIGHSGVDGGYDGTTNDTFHYYFDATRAENEALAVLPYQRNGEWSYQASTEFVDPGMAECGNYGAGGRGTDSSRCSLLISHGMANLNLGSDTVAYRYSASYCRWDSTGNDVTTSIDSGSGLLGFAEMPLAFSLTDSTLTGRVIPLANVFFEDRACGYFFIWVSASNLPAAYSAGSVKEYKIQFPLPTAPSAVPRKLPDIMAQIYPNPATDYVYVQAHSRATALQIYDLNGVREPLNISRTGDGYAICIKGLLNGSYELVERAEGRLTTEIFVVWH